jgi:polar amino acid transport system substrate-binding protein
MRQFRLLTLACLLPVLCAADPAPLPSPSTLAAQPDHMLVIATKEAAPFAMKGSDGEWRGISIDLWRRIADQLHLHYRFAEMSTVQDLTNATAAGTADAAVAAITVTAARARTSDFTQPFYETGLGVAVAGGTANWLSMLRTFLSFGFLQAVLALLGIALVVGILVWLFERRENDHFAGHPVRGLTSGIWWSAVAMTQAGAAQGGPASLPGRLLAVVWMIASIITLAVFTAGITSSITTHQLQGLVRNVDDLRSLRVGVVDSSSTVEFLDSQRIAHSGFADPKAGLQALQSGGIDAFVYDRPLLTWMVRQQFSGLQVLGVTFDRQNYAFALPPDSPLRVRLDIALLDNLDSQWWQQLLYRYLGSPAAASGE